MGAVTKQMEKHKTSIPHGQVDIRYDQAVVKRFNCTLAEQLFWHQYAVEMRLPKGQRSSEWVISLPAVVSALNGEVTLLTGKKPAEAIKEKAVYSKLCTNYNRTVGMNENKLPTLLYILYFYQPGELEGGCKRATYPIWSLKVYSIKRSVTKPVELVLFYLYYL